MSSGLMTSAAVLQISDQARGVDSPERDEAVISPQEMPWAKAAIDNVNWNVTAMKVLTDFYLAKTFS